MQHHAEPLQPPRRERRVFRWVVVSLTVLLLASITALFLWGDSEKLPGFAKVWKLRGELLVCQIRYGRDKDETHSARLYLAYELEEQGFYGSADYQELVPHRTANARSMLLIAEGADG